MSKDTSLNEVNQERIPSVSIGLPVYNGENYIEEALLSILGQDYKDFELIITDNASTDDTRQICQRFVEADSRIRYYRNSVNRGAAWNYNRAFALARGTYFKWAAHDDVLAPTFLSRCVEVLEKDDSVVIAYARTAHIDERGAVIRVLRPQHQWDAHEAHRRFRDLASSTLRHPIFGLIRRAALLRSNLMGSYADSDGNLLAELGLMGRVVEIEDVLFSIRIHKNISTHKYKNSRERAVWFDASKTREQSFPAWESMRDYWRAIVHAPLGAGERLKCMAHLAALGRRRFRVLGGEAKIRLRQLMQGRRHERQVEAQKEDSFWMEEHNSKTGAQP